MNEKNKHEYVNLMVKWKIERGMGEQMEQLISGFDEVSNQDLGNTFFESY